MHDQETTLSRALLKVTFGNHNRNREYVKCLMLVTLTQLDSGHNAVVRVDSAVVEDTDRNLLLLRLIPDLLQSLKQRVP